MEGRDKQTELFSGLDTTNLIGSLENFFPFSFPDKFTTPPAVRTIYVKAMSQKWSFYFSLFCVLHFYSDLFVKVEQKFRVFSLGKCHYFMYAC